MPDEEEVKKEKKKRPSAREIVGSIFEEKKTNAPQEHGSSALFESPKKEEGAPAPQEKQTLSTAPPKQAHLPPRPEKTPPTASTVTSVQKKKALTHWLNHRTLRSLLSFSKKPDLPPKIQCGEWVDHPQFPVGIEIGSRAIKAVQLAAHTNGGKKWKLINCAVRPLNIPDGTPEKEEVKYIEHTLRLIFGRDLRQLASVSCFTSPTNVAQVLRLPQIPKGEIRQAVAWELQEKYSMRSEDWYFDCLELEDAPQATHKDLSVLIAAIPRKQLELHISALRAAGVSPIAVEVKPLPTWEMLEHYAWPGSGALLLVELGEANSFVTVVVGGIPAFIHTLDFSGHTTTKVIQELLRLSFEEAEILKHHLALAASTGETPSAESTQHQQALLAIRPFLERLVSEIEQAFKYFSFRLSQSDTRSFSKIILSGKTAHLKGLREYIQERLGVPVEFTNPFAYMDIDEAVFDRKELESESLGLATAVGLAKHEGAR